ncbi:MAG: hypothetical protein KatS3mg066_2573 [Fischerella sp.]|nr:MAG: hypothetical protein KatS3mg066_2573 [Fischerella sp.]
MLKLTYTETSFHLECLAQSLEEWGRAASDFDTASRSKSVC